NEKYIGDSLCQKTFTTDTFPFTRKYNTGELDQFYIDQTHPAIITREIFEQAQELRQMRAQRVQYQHPDFPLTQKIVCGECGSVFSRKESKNGYVAWVCRNHDHRAANCPVGRIAENKIYAAFVRMYNKLKQHEGIILKPALIQLKELNTALQRGNPAMLAVNKAIAETSEQSYKISQLQSRGLLDADACAARLRDINAKLTELRRERRRLLRNEDFADMMEALYGTVDAIRTGPEKLEVFDVAVFTDLVEKITAESTACIRFQLYGNIGLREHLQETGR
ncbi:MAG: recombinase family protein, partial [Oscillospiraceae bacterium]|nr:recombinase family protein [Oscillospiraceae bacterium]